MDQSTIRAFLLILWIAILGATPLNPLLASPGNEANLYRVRNIFLETRTQGNSDLSDLGMAAFANLRPALREALISYGFTIVENQADADAVMYGGNTREWINLDGPPIDPPKYGFQFWLSSTKYNFKWESQFNVQSRGNEPEVGRKAVQKAARNLFKAWKKSATKAGIKVGEKLP